MNRQWLRQALQTMGGTFQTTLKRFPVTVVFVLALTLYLFHLISIEAKGDEKLFWVTGYYLSTGTLLSLTLHLWCEEVKRNSRKWMIQITMHALLIADTWFLYSLSPERSLTEIGIAHAAALFALGLSVFFLSFTQAKNDIPSWNFATSSIGALATSLVIGSIMSGGISLLILSLHTLFGIDVSYKCYLYILTLCNVCLALFLFLGLLPQGKEKHNDRPLPNAFLNSIIHYLFLPLEIGYMIVLYIYAGSILANWELPIGWVSWLVTIMMGGCIIIEFGLYPARMEKEKRADRLIARWLPILALPLLILMTVSIGRRLQDYGITINRLYLLTFNLWCYLVCIGLLTNRARRISWIPISFACIFLLVSIPSGQLCQHHPQQNTQGHRNQPETGHHTPASLIERHLRNLPERNAPCAGSKPERPYPLHARLVRMGKLAGPGCLKRFTLYITRNRTGIPFLPRTNVFASFCQYTARIQQTDGYRTTNLRHRQRIARNMVEKRNIARIDRRDKRHPLLRPQYPKRAESVRNRANASNRPPMQFTREILHSDPFLIELQRTRA